MENQLNQLEIKTATMAEQMKSLETRNTSEHKEIISKVNAIGEKIACFVTQKEFDKELGDLDKRQIKSEVDIEKIKSWMWKAIGVTSTLLFIATLLITLFKDKLF